MTSPGFVEVRAGIPSTSLEPNPVKATTSQLR
jgi:hypothetical protein